jgi:hypothetical protein
MQGRKASFWHFQIGTNQLRETTLTENIDPPEFLGVGRGADNSNLEKISRKLKKQQPAGLPYGETAMSKGSEKWMMECSVIMKACGTLYFTAAKRKIMILE